ncbi:hypothetical protein LCGC14_1538840 [marine sediment metagenome]|uniref:CMP/dCMP-type deaminase domain-containing protein n=1 Tax=marine sediment metagenome TaxID=412755 RepID=A0A0F9LUG0_9ZZZZ
MNTDTFKYEAMLQSTRSIYKQPMGAVVVCKGQIVGRGFNKVHSTGVPRLDGRHAEREALNNTTAKYRKNSTIYVCRLAKDGSLALAKPCHACYTVMKKMGVKYVWFSTSSDWIRMIL